MAMVAAPGWYPVAIWSSPFRIRSRFASPGPNVVPLNALSMDASDISSVDDAIIHDILKYEYPIYLLRLNRLR